ncbi:MAG: TIGR02300 family protein [Candidatus Paracaedibacteraceae bacterium]|nr:TIGR02300 family protein [Candidatus Paracaedibacteraceae bacterium]
MVKLEWGTKRTCLGCGSRFYDLQKLPPLCPKCGTVFEIQTVARGRRGKAAIVDVSKDLLALDGIGADLDIDLNDDIAVDIDNDLIEDADDLDEGLSDIPELGNDHGDH